MLLGILKLAVVNKIVRAQRVQFGNQRPISEPYFSQKAQLTHLLHIQIRLCIYYNPFQLAWNIAGKEQILATLTVKHQPAYPAFRNICVVTTCLFLLLLKCFKRAES